MKYYSRLIEEMFLIKELNQKKKKTRVASNCDEGHPDLINEEKHCLTLTRWCKPCNFVNYFKRN